MRGSAKSTKDQTNTDDADIVGVLSRKRTDHGIFEDPYKSKVKCWLKEKYFYILTLAADQSLLPGVDPQKLDITECKVRNPAD